MDGDNDFNGVSVRDLRSHLQRYGGTWEGSFYDAANAQNDEAPGTVVGTFNADIGKCELAWRVRCNQAVDVITWDRDLSVRS